MATLVGGFGCSHSPQLCIPPDGWLAHGDREVGSDHVAHLAPSRRSAADLLAEIAPDRLSARYEACQRAMAALGREMLALAPDVVIVVGDDQKELFLDDNMPAVAVYWGNELEDRPPGKDAYPPSMHVAYSAYHADEPEPYPVSSALGRHLVERLVDDGFDVSQFSVQPASRSLGHAFTFLRRRVFVDGPFQLVPVLLNTYFPPNQPTPTRCFDLGRALAAAVESWDEDARVALVASGGLSHPIIDEDLDLALLAALRDHDEDALRNLPVPALVEGTSEIRNWVTVGGALERFCMSVVDYVPAYRSRIGSGCGMAFATWRDPGTAS